MRQYFQDSVSGKVFLAIKDRDGWFAPLVIKTDPTKWRRIKLEELDTKYKNAKIYM